MKQKMERTGKDTKKRQKVDKDGEKDHVWSIKDGDKDRVSSINDERKLSEPTTSTSCAREQTYNGDDNNKKNRTSVEDAALLALRQHR